MRWPENSDGAVGGAERERGWRRWNFWEYLCPRHAGHGRTRACGQCLRAMSVSAKLGASLGRGWVENGRNPDIGPRYSSVLPQTDARGEDGSRVGVGLRISYGVCASNALGPLLVWWRVAFVMKAWYFSGFVICIGVLL